MTDQRRKYTFNDGLSNLLAGISVAYLTFPLQSLKKFFQCRKVISESCNYQLRAINYPFYRGIPTTFIQLSSDQLANKYLLSSQSSELQKAIFAFSCGITGALTSTAVENLILVVLKDELSQIGHSKGIIKNIVHKSPLWALKILFQQSRFRIFQTYPLIAIRDGIFTLWMFYIRDCEFYQKKNSQLLKIGICSIGAIISHPFDTLATKLQMNLGREQRTYAQLCQEIFMKEGFGSFYAGIFYRISIFYAFTNLIPAFRQYFNENLFLNKSSQIFN